MYSLILWHCASCNLFFDPAPSSGHKMVRPSATCTGGSAINYYKFITSATLAVGITYNMPWLYLGAAGQPLYRFHFAILLYGFMIQ